MRDITGGTVGCAKESDMVSGEKKIKKEKKKLNVAILKRTVFV